VIRLKITSPPQELDVGAQRLVWLCTLMMNKVEFQDVGGRHVPVCRANTNIPLGQQGKVVSRLHCSALHCTALLI
jgi:hypothetical protein